MAGSRSRLGVIFLTVLIDLIGFGIIIPILPFYAQEFGAAGLGYGALMGAYSGMQFLANTLLGRVSDRFGRRPILLTTMLINVVGYLMFAAAGSFWVLFVARLVSGLASGNIGVAQAYIADVTTREDRSKGMGVIGAAFGLGFIIGPGIGGMSSHFFGHAAPGLVAAGLSLFNFALAWRILPESLREEHRSERKLFDFGHLEQGFANPRLRSLMLVWGLVPLAFAGYSVVMPLYMAQRFQWGELQLSYLFIVIGLTASVVQGWGFGKLSKRTGDRPLLVVGTIGMVLAIAVLPFLRSTVAIYGWTVVLAFSNSLFAPAASGMVSVLADPAAQGITLGVAQSLSALGRFSGPELMGGVYDGAGPRAAFLAAAAVMGLAVLAAARIPSPAAAASVPSAAD